MAHPLTVSTIRMKQILTAFRAEQRNFDVLFTHAGVQQLPPIRPSEVEMWFRPLGAPDDCGGIGNLGRYFFSDFIAARTNMRPDRNDELRRIDAEFFNQSHRRRFGNLGSRASPARMYGSNSPSVGICNQDWNTIRSQDTQH